jgi:hypothetical protein
MGSRTEILFGLSSTYLATWQVKKYSNMKILEYANFTLKLQIISQDFRCYVILTAHFTSFHFNNIIWKIDLCFGVLFEANVKQGAWVFIFAARCPLKNKSCCFLQF